MVAPEKRGGTGWLPMRSLCFVNNNLLNPPYIVNNNLLNPCYFVNNNLLNP